MIRLATLFLTDVEQPSVELAILEKTIVQLNIAGLSISKLIFH